MDIPTIKYDSTARQVQRVHDNLSTEHDSEEARQLGAAHLLASLIQAWDSAESWRRRAWAVLFSLGSLLLLWMAVFLLFLLPG